MKAKSRSKRRSRSPQGHRPKQLHLIKPTVRFFGGRLLHGRRKGKRPLSSKDPIHIVMRSTWAMGPFLFLRKGIRAGIECLIANTASRYHVRIYKSSIQGNHIHLVVKVPHVRYYKAFIRVLTGKIASFVMGGRSFKQFVSEHPAGAGARKRDSSVAVAAAAVNVRAMSANNERPLPTTTTTQSLDNTVYVTQEPQGKGQQFWQFRPFTRVLHWGKDFKTCCAYVLQNTLEALGFVAYKKRGRDPYARWVIESLELEPRPA